MYRSPERSPQDSWEEFFWYSAQASFSWPSVDLARLLSVFLDYILSVRQSLWDSFLYLLLSYFYDPGMFIFRWSSNFVEKENGGEDGILCLLPCICTVIFRELL